MFGSTTLDIALGITFMYLLLSLVVTAVQEVIETLIKLRASHLAKGIEKLLGSPMAKNFFANLLIKAFSPNQWFGQGTRKPLSLTTILFADLRSTRVPQGAQLQRSLGSLAPGNDEPDQLTEVDVADVGMERVRAVPGR